ncbi:MAG: hypothetical protein JWP02_1549 [Acidimicrobiales bacterium]|nr:hypothetical protein [Acidimicrobiales bacterium]
MTQDPGALTHATVVDVVLDEDVLDDDELDDDELDDEVVVALTQTVDAARVEAEGQPEPHVWPAGQQVRLAPLPHGVVPAGHPQRPCDADWHATPALQQRGPHGVVPLGQQHELDGSEQVPPFGQHPWPQATDPAGQVTASALLKGRKKAAAAAAAPVAPSTFKAPRREVGAAMARDSSSKDRFISLPPLGQDHAPDTQRYPLTISRWVRTSNAQGAPFSAGSGCGRR